jgi:hypothetical protein
MTAAATWRGFGVIWVDDMAWLMACPWFCAPGNTPQSLHHPARHTKGSQFSFWSDAALRHWRGKAQPRYPGGGRSDKTSTGFVFELCFQVENSRH